MERKTAAEFISEAMNVVVYGESGESGESGFWVDRDLLVSLEVRLFFHGFELEARRSIMVCHVFSALGVTPYLIYH